MRTNGKDRDAKRKVRPSWGLGAVALRLGEQSLAGPFSCGLLEW